MTDLHFTPGDRVTRAGYPGTIVAEYLPGMYEVRLPGGIAVVPASELTPA